MEHSEFGRIALDAGRQLLTGAVLLSGAVVLLPIVAALLKDRRLVLAARAGLYGVFFLVAGASACLVTGFITGQYDNEYVYNYSEKALRLPYKIAGLWAGLRGSLLFWSLILAGYSAAAAFQHHWSARHPVGRRLEPWVYCTLGVVLLFFTFVTQHVENPFEWMDMKTRFHVAQQMGISVDADGHVGDGAGLNPQLENYWMIIHPPSLYMGFVGFTVPFAFAIASLIAREGGDYWIKVTRRWTMVAWLFLTNGVILGGLWAYEMLGWGGYWAWDPVENASLLPWLTGTAFLHSVMIQERRDMLKAWNVFLIFLTFFMTIVATYMTRSGVVDSVHAFAGGDIGTWFLWFMGVIAAVSLFILFFRLPDLRGKHKLESLLSREAAFYFNNLVLVAIAIAVYFLSMFPKISHDFFAFKQKVGEPHYNQVTTPLFLLLTFLTAIGPQIGWVKATAENLQRNFIVPGLVSVVSVLSLLGVWYAQDLIPTLRKLFVPYFYPTALAIGLAIFVLGTVYTEFHRGIKSRMKFRGEGFFQSIASLFAVNNRRYGGYVVHVGFGLVVIGVVVSSFFRSHEEFTLRAGDQGKVGDYTVEVVNDEVSGKMTPPGPGQPYAKEAQRFLFRNAGGKVVADLLPERHFYPKKRDAAVLSQPEISRNLVNDYYVHYQERLPGGEVKFEAFVNPWVNWIWAGWLIMIAGGILAIIPMPQRGVGLAE